MSDIYGASNTTNEPVTPSAYELAGKVRVALFDLYHFTGERKGQRGRSEAYDVGSDALAALVAFAKRHEGRYEWSVKKRNELANARARAQAAEDALRVAREALDEGRRFERAYQESLGATPTVPQWERLESLQSAFIDAYVPALAAIPQPEDGA